MYCSNCGKELGNYKVCEDCNPKIETHKSFKNGLKYGLLGFSFPLSAIVIIYMIGKKDPVLVKYFKAGAIVSIIFVGILYVFSVLLNIVALIFGS